MAPWLMLFDIHEASHHQELFEDLALDFAVRFERSPPVWAPTVDARQDAPSDALKFQFGQIFSAVDKARLQHFLLEAATATSVSLDFSQTPAPPPAYAKSLLDCIQRLRQLDKPIEVIGGPGFIVRLNSACSGERGDESGWLLLLAMEELMGDANGFEAIALAYAIRFEISPPSFVAPKALPDTTAPLEPVSEHADSFRLEGLIGSKAAGQFEALEGFAVGRARVEVDLARVTRIDFACTGQVLDTLIRLKERGCQIRLKNCNTLVLALLRMIGADQYASLSLRKRT
jgi:anti-anti-sigma regulatory factor